MLSLELERAFVEAPKPILELRLELGDAIAASRGNTLSHEDGADVVHNYTEAVSHYWSDVVTDTITAELGSTIATTPRLDLFYATAPIIREAARVEAEVVTNFATKSPELSRRERFVQRGRHLLNRFLIREVAVEDATDHALARFVIELNDVQLGDITTPEDLGEVARLTALKTLPYQVATLDEHI